MKEEFLNFLNRLMEANPELTESLMNDNVKAYIKDVLSNKEIKDKPLFSENGLTVFKFLKNNTDATAWSAKVIAAEVNLTSRQVSGCARKLVNDGFLEKVSENPVYYALSQKGKDFELVEEEN